MCFSLMNLSRPYKGTRVLILANIAFVLTSNRLLEVYLFTEFPRVEHRGSLGANTILAIYIDLTRVSL